MILGRRNGQRDGGGGAGGWRALRRVAARWWRELRAAAAFLTLLPGPTKAPRPPSIGGGFLAAAMPMFPLVGAAVGAVAGVLLLAAAGLGLPPLAGALLAVATVVVMTGALHEDGLGDVADGFGGGRGRDDKLRIMRDSRVGAYGVVAIVLSLGLRAAALASLPAALGAAAFVAAAASSRAALPAILRWLPPARLAGMAADAGRPDAAAVATAAAIGAAIALVAVGPVTGVVAAAVAALAAAVVAVLARWQIGGHTGDVCGAAQQAAEVAALLAVAALL